MDSQTGQNENKVIAEAPDDKTFNRLKEIQTLIKKESSLRELCKNIINNFIQI
jgi:hypothetical protein